MKTCTSVVQHFTFDVGFKNKRKDYLGICNSESTIDQLKVAVFVKDFAGKNDDFRNYLWNIRKQVAIWMLRESPDNIIQQKFIAANIEKDCEGAEFPGGVLFPLLICMMIIKEYPASTFFYFETYGTKTRVQYKFNKEDFSLIDDQLDEISKYLYDNNKYTSVCIMERFINLLKNICVEVKGNMYIGIGCTIAPPSNKYMVCAKTNKTSYEDHLFEDLFIKSNNKFQRQTFLPIKDKNKNYQFSVLGRLCPMNILPTNFIYKASIYNMSSTIKHQFYYPDFKNSLGELGKNKNSFLASNLNLASASHEKDLFETDLKILFKNRAFKFIESAKASGRLWSQDGLCCRVEITKCNNMNYVSRNNENWLINVIRDGVNEVIKIKQKSLLYDINVIKFFHDITIDSYRAKAEIILQAVNSNTLSDTELSEELQSVLDDLMISIKHHYSGSESLRIENKSLCQFPFLSFATSRPVKSQLSMNLNTVRSKLLSKMVGPISFNETNCLWQLFLTIIKGIVPSFEQMVMPVYLTMQKSKRDSSSDLSSHFLPKIYKVCKHCNTIFIINKDVMSRFKGHACKSLSYQIASLIDVRSKEFDEILQNIINSLDIEQKNIYDTVTSLKSNNCMVYGAAGCGKSYLLKAVLMQNIKSAKSSEDFIRLSSTNIAANNISGLTFDSYFCNYPDDKNNQFTSFEELNVIKHSLFLQTNHKEKYDSIMNKLKCIAIDEFPSSLNAQGVDKLSLLLQHIRVSTKPFGGVIIQCFGCVFQIPSIIKSSQMFFESSEFQKGEFIIKQLTRVKRQNENEFVVALNDCINPNRKNESCFEILNNRCGSKVPLQEVRNLIRWIKEMMMSDEEINSRNKNNDPNCTFYRNQSDKCNYNANHEIYNNANIERLENLCCELIEQHDYKPTIIVNTSHHQVKCLEKLWIRDIIENESPNKNIKWRFYKGNFSLNDSKDVLTTEHHKKIINHIEKNSKQLPKIELLIKCGESVMFHKSKSHPNLKYLQRGIIKEVKENSIIIQPISSNPDLFFPKIEVFHDSFILTIELRMKFKKTFYKTKEYKIKYNQFPIMNGKFLLAHQLQSLTIGDERIIYNNHGVFKPFEGFAYMIGTRTILKDDILFLFKVVADDFKYRTLIQNFCSEFSNFNENINNLNTYKIIENIDYIKGIINCKLIEKTNNNGELNLLAANGYYQYNHLKNNQLEKNEVMTINDNNDFESCFNKCSDDNNNYDNSHDDNYYNEINNNYNDNSHDDNYYNDTNNDNNINNNNNDNNNGFNNNNRTKNIYHNDNKSNDVNNIKLLNNFLSNQKAIESGTQINNNYNNNNNNKNNDNDDDDDDDDDVNNEDTKINNKRKFRSINNEETIYTRRNLKLVYKHEIHEHIMKERNLKNIKVEYIMKERNPKKAKKKQWTIEEEIEAAKYFELIGYGGYHTIFDLNDDVIINSEILQEVIGKLKLPKLIETINKLKEFEINSDQLKEKLKYFCRVNIFERRDSN
jgi:hypothetical protein